MGGVGITGLGFCRGFLAWLVWHSSLNTWQRFVVFWVLFIFFPFLILEIYTYNFHFLLMHHPHPLSVPSLTDAPVFMGVEFSHTAILSKCASFSLERWSSVELRSRHVGLNVWEERDRNALFLATLRCVPAPCQCSGFTRSIATGLLRVKSWRDVWWWRLAVLGRSWWRLQHGGWKETIGRLCRGLSQGSSAPPAARLYKHSRMGMQR